MTNAHLAFQFFVQLAVILVFCRLVGLIAARFGQPQSNGRNGGGHVARAVTLRLPVG
jgi:Kef-type K+ transport system membrane component KefB